MQAEVRTLVRSQALRRSQGGMLAGQGITDFARFNRVEGLALGAGAGVRAGSGVSITARGRYGFADERAKATADIAWRNATGWGLRGYVSDDHRDVGDVAERSGFSNSIAAQEFAQDFTSPYRVRAVGIEGRAPWRGMSVALRISREEQSRVAVNATPATRSFVPTLPVDSGDAWRSELRLVRPTQLWWGGTEMRAELALRSTSLDSARAHRGFVEIEMSRPAKSARVVSRTLLGGVTSTAAIPIQEMVYFGGPFTAPGYRYHSLADDAAFSQRLEVQFPIPFPALSLGRFGRSAATATLAPFVSAVGLRHSGVYPSIGLGTLVLFDLIRLDVARGLRPGSGTTTWSIDVTRAFWSIL